MDDRSRTRTWRAALAAVVLLRPLCVLPMAPSGPLGGSALLPLGLAALVGGSVLLAVAIVRGRRAWIALGVATGVAGVPLAIAGAAAGLPMPWPAVVVAYNAALSAIGIGAWRATRPARAPTSGQPPAG